jgi:hypothetical protein
MCPTPAASDEDGPATTTTLTRSSPWSRRLLGPNILLAGLMVKNNPPCRSTAAEPEQQSFDSYCAVVASGAMMLRDVGSEYDGAP